MLPVSAAFNWQSFTEEAPTADDGDTFAKWGLYEQLNLTRDFSDYLWYLTDVNIASNEPFLKNGKDLILTIMSAGDTLQVFVNGQPSGIAYGSLANPKLTFTGTVKLRAGINMISFLSSSVGLGNIGVHYKTYNTGVLGPVTLMGLNEGTRDLTKQKWSYKVGLKGQALSLHTLGGSSSAEWLQGSLIVQKQPLSWYKATFNAPQESDPLALDMSIMGKGQIWINGDYAGTHTETKCLSNCEQPSKKWYHVPRSWLKPTGNQLVIFEEWGGFHSGFHWSEEHCDQKNEAAAAALYYTEENK